jgi:hypothetical protein
MITSMLLISVLASPAIESQLPIAIPVYKKVKSSIKNSNIDKLFKLCPKIAEKHVLPKTMYNSSQLHLAIINNCLGVKRMLVVGWYGEASPLDLTWAKLISLHYAAYASKKENTSYVVKHLSLKTKSTNMSISKHDPRPWFSFFKLIKKH